MTKSREIPLTELFKNLQLEFISYHLRGKIYDRPLDVNSFNDICRLKRQKIETFCLRNSVTSIFDNEDRLNKYLQIFYPEKYNKPNFQYSPKNQKWLRFWDTFHFYREGNLVEYKGQLLPVEYNKNHYSELSVGVQINGNIVDVKHKDVRVKSIYYIAKDSYTDYNDLFKCLIY